MLEASRHWAEGRISFNRAKSAAGMNSRSMPGWFERGHARQSYRQAVGRLLSGRRFLDGADIAGVTIGGVDVFYRMGVSNRDGINPDSMRAKVDIVRRRTCCWQSLIAHNGTKTRRGICRNKGYGRAGASPHCGHARRKPGSIAKIFRLKSTSASKPSAVSNSCTRCRSIKVMVDLLRLCALSVALYRTPCAIVRMVRLID